MKRYDFWACFLYEWGSSRFCPHPRHKTFEVAPTRGDLYKPVQASLSMQTYMPVPSALQVHQPQAWSA